jgi:DNA-binding NtrC family response regulator
MHGVVRHSTGDIDTDVAGAIVDPDATELVLLVSIDGRLSSHPLGWSAITLGRSGRNDVVIDHASVSRTHAELTSAPLTIRDVGSTNGVRVRGERIDVGVSVALEPGDAVQLGDVVVLVQRLGVRGTARPWKGELLDGRLAEECARSSRSGAPFGFARVHVEVVGGVEGDPARVEIEAALRTTDLFADAGHGQFQILLLDTPAAAARSVIERLVARLKSRGVTARWGVAAWPRDGTTAEQLAAHAWTALRAPGGVMARVRGLIEQISDSALSVLIRGETGVGKELCAETIHRLSGRAKKPFVRLNCAALNEHLLESELFGHERGSFTGAHAAKPGLIETADGGTLFLDEVGDLPRQLQAKLLRVLEDRVVQRVGAIEGHAVDVRFVSATNRSLESDISAGRFRRDLYFRLGGVTIEIPPLRDRVEEIEGLVEAFVTRAAANTGRRAPEITDRARVALRGHAWPGNVRELRNAIDRAMLLCGNGPLDVDHLSLSLLDNSVTGPIVDDPDAETPRIASARSTRATAPMPALPAVPVAGGGMPDETLRGEVARVESRRIALALQECGGNQTRAARQLGISRNTLQARMDAFGIPRPRKPAR